MSIFAMFKLRKYKKQVRLNLKEIKKVLSKNAYKIEEHQLNMVNAEIEELESYTESCDDLKSLERRCLNFAHKTDKITRPLKKSVVREYAEAIITAVVLALLLRTFVVQAFKIPTGSMQPTLHGANYFGIGDRILVNKFIYGAKSPTGILFTDIKIPYFQLPKIREPKRGDIIVFTTSGISLLDEEDQGKDFIKRLVGLPGDEIEIVGLVRDHLFAKCEFCGEVHRIVNPFKVFAPDGNIYLEGECSKCRHIIRGGAIAPDEGVLLVNGKILDTPEIFKKIPYLNEGPFGARYKSIVVPEHSYFVLGDNSSSSKDSRFWGYVPEENLRGGAFFKYWPPKRIGITR